MEVELFTLLETLVSWLGPPLLLAVALYAGVTAKTLPFAWHVRIIYGYLRYSYFNKRSVPVSTDGALTLFQPTIYTTSTPPGDIDYSMHKSNSTYFSDLDLARGHHIFGLFRQGFNEYSKRGRRVFPVLGGAACTFKREICPFEKFEIWTRVLSWDSKWIYLISHFVRAAKSSSPARYTYTDQPWRKSRTTARVDKTEETESSQPVVYAISISKYVVKQGRKTIPPDEFLAACGLLTRGPEDCMSSADSRAPAVETASDTSSTCNQGSRSDGTLGESHAVGISQEQEERRRKGLELANHLAALDAGQEIFSGDDEIVFAKY